MARRLLMPVETDQRLSDHSLWLVRRGCRTLTSDTLASLHPVGKASLTGHRRRSARRLCCALSRSCLRQNSFDRRSTRAGARGRATIIQPSSERFSALLAAHRSSCCAGESHSEAHALGIWSSGHLARLDLIHRQSSW